MINTNWQQVMLVEIVLLEANITWEHVPKSANKFTIGCRVSIQSR